MRGRRLRDAACRAAAPGLVALALLLAVGCDREETRRRRTVLRNLPGNPAVAAVPMYRVHVVRLRHRMRPDAPEEDVWRLLGAQAVPDGKARLWFQNDLLIGEGAGIAADRVEALLTETPDREVATSEIRVRENFDFRLSLGFERDTLDFVWTEDGELRGRHFEAARADLRFVCRRDPDNPDAVVLAVVPEVSHGEERLKWVETAAGFTKQMVRPRFTLDALAVEAALRPGRMLVVGGRRRSPVSLGAVWFYDRRGPDLWKQTLILTAELYLPGAEPEAGPGLTVPEASKPAPAPAPAPPE